MITANALGIPTRLVENEAHAFVEVWFPERSWQRIDLGGAALAHGGHRRRQQDAAPAARRRSVREAAGYKQNYTQLEGDINGLTRQQIADKHNSLDQSPPSGAFGNDRRRTDGTAAPQDRLITPDPTLPAVTHDPKKHVVKLTVTQADQSAYRGDPIHVEGVADANGKALPGPPDRRLPRAGRQRRRQPRQLGTAMTGADGTFTRRPHRAADLARRRTTSSSEPRGRVLQRRAVRLSR